MQLVSVNVGLPREVTWKGRIVTTGIFKEPVEGRVRVRRLNLAGDQQADVSVHGGPDKAIYAYPSEHYRDWRGELPGMELPWGMFGENLTTEGLLEDTVHIGDTLRIGTAVMMVTRPRLPCYKLGIRFGRSDMIKRFRASRRSGFYLAVLQEGEVAAGDPIEVLRRDRHAVAVADIIRLSVHEVADPDLLHRVVQVAALPESWRSSFQEQIEQITS